MRHLRLILLGILVYGLVSIRDRALTQDDAAFVYTGDIANIYWSHDSQSVVFSSYYADGVFATSDDWYEYNIHTGELNISNYWFLQPDFTDEQRDRYGFAGSENEPPFIFISPNGEYIVYGSREKPKSWANTFTYPLAVASLSSEEHFVTNIPVKPFDAIRNSFGVEVFRVGWSEDSSAFLVALISDFGSQAVYYVYGYAEAVEALAYTAIYVVEVGGKVYPIDTFFDISLDNNRLLLGPINGVLVYDVEDEANHQLILEPAGNIYDAMFVCGSHNEMLFISRQTGLASYNMASNEIVVLDERITMGVFSPDGQFVAWLSQDEDRQLTTMYIVTVQKTDMCEN